MGMVSLQNLHCLLDLKSICFPSGEISRLSCLPTSSINFFFTKFEIHDIGEQYLDNTKKACPIGLLCLVT